MPLSLFSSRTLTLPTNLHSPHLQFKSQSIAQIYPQLPPLLNPPTRCFSFIGVDLDASEDTLLGQELPDVPFFLSLHNLCATLKCTSPSAVIFYSAVINAGYRISGTHVNPLGLKSDAPMEVTWDIMHCWANFARAASLSKAPGKKVARFLPNPERHWAQSLGQVVPSPASMCLYWVQKH